MSRKNPTMAEAVAAGTHITLSSIFFSNVQAIRETNVKAWARSEWIAANNGRDNRGPGPQNPRPNHAPVYPNRAAWVTARQVQGRDWLRMTKGMTEDALLALVPVEDRVGAVQMTAQKVSAARQCVALVEATK